MARQNNNESVHSNGHHRRLSISNETNTATPSAEPFRPSRDTLHHSLVSHDENGLNTALSVRRPDQPTISVAAPSVRPVIPARKGITATATTTTTLDPSNTHDDEIVRFPTAVVARTAVADAKLSPSEFVRITDKVMRVSGDHSPPDWNCTDEVDHSTVPGTEEYGTSSSSSSSKPTSVVSKAARTYSGGERLLAAGRRVASKL